ncbi:hypothetical protein COO60DRAFT_1657258 [Scenedesmus sp. NREL 46B-D3]|nr:hypothetical protein COO60DRAFT_1657258 [Scenedesmus sp. NREL 46B-D3]
MYAVSKLFGLMTPMVSQGSRDSPCARAVPNLTECATDGSLQVKEGCCSAACAGKMQQALVSSGRQCYREFIEVMCNSTEIRESISGVLFGAAKRCLGLQPSCELLSQTGDLLGATSHTNSNASQAAESPQQQEQQDGMRMQEAAANNGIGSSSASGQRQQQRQQQQQRGQYCPVPVVKYSREEYSTSALISTFSPLISQGPPSPCSAQVQGLATCAFDGSLEVKQGCCSIGCSEQMKQIIDNSCIPVLINAICNSTAEQEARVRPFVPVLLGAAQRCANFQPPPALECADGRVIPVLTGSTAGAGAPAAEAPMPEAPLPLLAAAPPVVVPAGNASGSTTA